METPSTSYDRFGIRGRQSNLASPSLDVKKPPSQMRPGPLTLKDRGSGERPREQILKRGTERLSDRELLEAILGSGVAGHPVTSLANRVLDILDREKQEPSAELLAAIPGLGTAKTALLCAMIEFGRRRWGPSRRRIRVPDDAWQIVKHLGDRRQEHFLSISLNGAHELIAMRVVSVGLVNRTVVHPREVFADPIVDRASAIILAHNHPSGSLEPSGEDDEVTTRLRESGALLGIEVIDHIIFSSDAWYSYLQERRL